MYCRITMVVELRRFVFVRVAIVNKPSIRSQYYHIEISAMYLTTKQPQGILI